MTVRAVAWFGVSGVALASWFAAASTSGVRAPIIQPPPQPTTIDRSMSSLESEVGHLRDRLAPTASPAGSRNLFRFASRVPVRASTADSAPAPAAPQSVAQSPAPTLIGIAEDVAPDGSAVRTAIVTLSSNLFLVKQGDSIEGRYRVEQVSTDAAQLVDTATNASVVLRLR